MHRVRLVLFLAFSLAALNCATTAPSTEVERRMQAYAHALQYEPPAVVASFYAADGALVLPHLDPITGPAAVEAFLKPMAASVEVKSVEVRTTSLRADGNTAHQEGTYAQVAGEKGKSGQLYRGTFVADWRRDRGEWRFTRLEMHPNQ